MYELVKQKFVTTHFPLHNDWEVDGRVRFALDENASNANVISHLNVLLTKVYDDNEKPHALAEIWTNGFFDTKIPLGPIRNYFGEKVAMYFSFAAFNGRHLIWPGVIGIVVFIV
jgi:hypothetical protein